MEIRSFLAFELPEQIKKIVSHASEDMRNFALNVRWVRVNNIHLTIVFLGNVPPEHLRPIQDTVGEICQRYGPFHISLKGTGVFSSRRKPRVLWIGLDGDVDRMSDFRDALQKDLEPFGTKQEKRRFNPHLTLGRFRKGARPGADLDNLLSRYQDLTSPVCVLGNLVLFRSDLKPGGAVYTKQNTWPLTGRT